MSTTDAKQAQEKTDEITKTPQDLESSADYSAEEIGKLKEELEEQKKKSAELSKRMLYLQADILNLQRQSDRREAQAREDVKLNYLLELALIREDLERALSTSGIDASSTLRDGLSMLVSRIDSNLKGGSLERIRVPVGAAFDPHMHEAVAYTETAEKNEGCILSVIGSGYMYKGKVIKPALVEVARQNRSSLGGGHSKESVNANKERRTEEKIEVGARTGDESQSEST